jgi:hypothetical protein
MQPSNRKETTKRAKTSPTRDDLARMGGAFEIS